MKSLSVRGVMLVLVLESLRGGGGGGEGEEGGEGVGGRRGEGGRVGDEIRVVVREDRLGERLVMRFDVVLVGWMMDVVERRRELLFFQGAWFSSLFEDSPAQTRGSCSCFSKPSDASSTGPPAPRGGYHSRWSSDSRREA
ncbi:hypothetical protein BDY24DRAFT_380948 [Mrakia frigida]|uniref:uncharacterized protein n=1 Tax=Mrakia frigida TaxID=29902 RepID=UPI003FCBF370